MMALETGADIVPIAIEQYGKEFYVNIGENISSKDCGSDVLAFTGRLSGITIKISHLRKKRLRL
jgi:hypothetical protein